MGENYKNVGRTLIFEKSSVYPEQSYPTTHLHPPSDNELTHTSHQHQAAPLILDTAGTGECSVGWWVVDQAKYSSLRQD